LPDGGLGLVRSISLIGNRPRREDGRFPKRAVDVRSGVRILKIRKNRRAVLVKRLRIYLEVVQRFEG